MTSATTIPPYAITVRKGTSTVVHVSITTTTMYGARLYEITVCGRTITTAGEWQEIRPQSDPSFLLRPCKRCAAKLARIVAADYVAALAENATHSTSCAKCAQIAEVFGPTWKCEACFAAEDAAAERIAQEEAHVGFVEQRAKQALHGRVWVPERADQPNGWGDFLAVTALSDAEHGRAWAAIDVMPDGLTNWDTACHAWGPVTPPADLY